MDRFNADISRALGNIESKLDQLLTDNVDQEQRLRRLESRGAWMSGAAAAVGALIGIVWNIITHDHTPKGNS
jgi:hypothetical protein